MFWRPLVAASLLAFLVPLSAQVAPGTVEAPSPPPERRSIVLVTVEAWRPDWLGSGGWSRPTSPRFDALAKEGVTFERVVTPMPAAAAAHLSLFTGTPPRVHGADTLAAPKGWTSREGTRTAAELLAGELYRCAAVLSHDGLGKASGVTAGFPVVDEPEQGVRDADTVVARAIKWLEVQRDERVFLWVHLKGGLEPNVPSAAQLERFPLAPVLEERLASLGVPADRFNQGGFQKTTLVRLFFPELDAPTIHKQFQVPRIDSGRFLELFRRYEADLASADAALGKLADALAATPVGRRAVLVVAGAYGQALGESSELGHGEMTRENLLVPALLCAEGLAARNVAATVSLGDLLASAAHAAGAKAGAKLFAQGAQDVLGAPVDGALASRPEREHEKNPPGPVHVLYTSRWRYVHRPTRTDQLFDLAADPREQTNVIAAHAEEAAALLAETRARLGL
jgi:arylsulfatase A-like enzyme